MARELLKEFANRVFFQKLKVYDQAKQKSAREMLAAIAPQTLVETIPGDGGW